MMRKHDSILIFVQFLFASVIILGSMYSALLLRPRMAKSQVLGVKTDMRRADFVEYKFDSFFVANTSVLQNNSTIKIIVSLKPVTQGKYYLGNVRIPQPGSYTLSLIPIDLPAKNVSLEMYSEKTNLVFAYPKEMFTTIDKPVFLQVYLNTLEDINSTSSFVIAITRAK